MATGIRIGIAALIKEKAELLRMFENQTTVAKVAEEALTCTKTIIKEITRMHLRMRNDSTE
jgi:hypothetical protein